MKKLSAFAVATAVIVSATAPFAQIQTELPLQYELSSVTFWEGPLMDQAPASDAPLEQFARYCC